MPNETRVNLKHLLEDLRDAYAAPIEEVIVTELIANALDGGAHIVRLETVPEARLFRCVDDGGGMNRVALRNYHNIAASTKERGEGIGFAGVGAKLSLLVAQHVITESRGKNGAHAAAEWYLKDAYKAPWKFVSFSGLIKKGRGTAVSLILKQGNNALLDEVFLTQTVQRHFYPIVSSEELIGKVMRTCYKKPIEVFVNGNVVEVGAVGKSSHAFSIYQGRHRKVIGAGFIEKAVIDQTFWQKMFGTDSERPGESGLRISTYGKVIRGGWEWLGLPIKHPELLSGVVEIPSLSSILTTNKSDFLSDRASLKKYYDVRKSVQRAVLPILRELGEAEEHKEAVKTSAAWKPLAHDIEGALSKMTESFPELEALIGEHWRRQAARTADVNRHRATGEKETDILPRGEVASAQKRESSSVREPLTEDKGGEKTKRTKQPGLEIAFEDFDVGDVAHLGRLVEERVVVNTAHPAWKRAEALGQEPYHVLLVVALTLGEYLQSSEGIPAFVSTFLKSWSEAAESSGRLF